MPVILSKDIELKWLDKNLTDSDKALALLEGAKEIKLDLVEVSKEVNTPKIDKPSLIKGIK